MFNHIMNKRLIYLVSAAIILGLSISSCASGSLPRKKPSDKMAQAFSSYLDAADSAGKDTVGGRRQDIHSIMILQHGKVVEEKWMGEGAPEKPHVLNSLSKTFTATAVGLAISENKLSLDDKLVDFFPEELPDTVSDNLKAVTVRDLLTMNCGHETDPTGLVWNMNAKPGEDLNKDVDWMKIFLSHPFVYKPGTFFCYNSLGTYVLSAIVQKVTGQKVVDYLTPRLFEPLHIDKPSWEESPQGINCGGWGLYLKTEDLAKMGQLFLQGGKWQGKQVLPADWVKAASSYQVPSMPSGLKEEELAQRGLTKENSDWVQGYGYQMWMCRHNAFRGDGAYGQYMIVIPDKDAVIAVTAHVSDMQAELNLIWENVYPAL